MIKAKSKKVRKEKERATFSMSFSYNELTSQTVVLAGEINFPYKTSNKYCNDYHFPCNFTPAQYLLGF